ncbi:MAG: TetR family transcriptional regulator [Janthinobacterium lividum]
MALELFARNGFDATTMDHIARAVGIARRTLFSYYQSKSAIVWDGQREAGNALAAALAGVAHDVPWRSALVDTLTTALRYPGDDVDLLRRRLSLIAATPVLRAHLVIGQEPVVDVVARFVAVREGCAEDDLTPYVITRATLTALSSALMWWSTSVEPDPRVVVRRALTTVLGDSIPVPGTTSGGDREACTRSR